jgi:drug/metabolite transporter (DMT)-like permease
MGELLSLMTALLWALGVVLYKKSVGFVPPFALSVFKAVVALVLMVATAVVVGQTFSVSVSPTHFIIILLSGALGIGIADTLYFMTLSRIGASRTALVDCLYSPLVILFSALMLDERLSRFAVFGGILILSSVLISSNKGFEKKISSQQLWAGCALGAGAMATVGFAIVLVKPLLPLYPLVWVSTVRMAGGLAALVLLMPLHPDRRAVLETFRPHTGWTWMLLGTFFGSYLSLLCWLAGFKYSQAGISALLNQTSTVLIVLLAGIILKEPLTRIKLLAVAAAFAGAAMVLLSQAHYF